MLLWPLLQAFALLCCLVSDLVGESSTLFGHAKMLAGPRGILLSQKQPFATEKSPKLFGTQALHHTPRFPDTFSNSRVSRISMFEANFAKQRLGLDNGSHSRNGPRTKVFLCAEVPQELDAGFLV
jgi:hypothetical protein